MTLLALFLCENIFIERMMEMFSKELEILDKNTVRYMIDEMQEELEGQKKEIKGQQKKLEDQSRIIHEDAKRMEEMNQLLKKREEKIRELMEKSHPDKRRAYWLLAIIKDEYRRIGNEI